MRIFFLVLMILAVPVLSHSQRRGEETSYKNVNEATKMAKQAEKLWKEERFAEAEQMYYKALAIYPVFIQLDEFAERQMKLGNIKGANKMWTAVAQTGAGLDWIYPSMASNNFKSGYIDAGMKAALNYLELLRGQKPEGSFSITIITATKVAFALEDKSSLQRMNEITKTMRGNITNDAKYGQAITDLYISILDGKYDQALSDLQELIEGKGNFMGARILAKETLPLVYILKNDFTKAEEAINELVSKNIFAKAKHLSNLSGLVALGRKNFPKAIEDFTIYLGLPVYQAPDKFKYYCKRAEAFEGLKEYDKARKDYEAALVYNPEYEPALNGLARSGRPHYYRTQD